MLPLNFIVRYYKQASNPMATYRPILTVLLMIMAAAAVKGAGGVLICSPTRGPSAECVIYRKLLTPREGITIAVQSDGKSVQIADSEIIANIPNPSPEFHPDAATISGFIQQCELQAIRSSNHSGVLKMTADLWRREKAALKKPSQPQAQPASSPSPQPSVASQIVPATNAPSKTPTEAQSPDLKATIEKLNSLVKLRNWRDLALSCQALASSPEENLRQIATGGSELLAAVQEYNLAIQNKTKAAAEATRIKRNADVIDHPNPLHPDDPAPMVRAGRMRDEATELQTTAENAVTEAKSRVDEAASAISAQISSSSQPTPGEEVAEARTDEGNPTAENPPNPPAAVDKASAEGEEATAGTFVPTLSLKFKGFSLNMSKEELTANLEKQFKDFGPITSKDTTKERQAFINTKVESFLATEFYVGGDWACLAVWEPGTKRQYMRTMEIDAPFARKLFNAENLDFKKFVEQFVSAYKVPIEKITKETDGYSETKSAKYESDQGWDLYIVDQNGLLSIGLYRTTPVRATTFGD